MPAGFLLAYEHIFSNQKKEFCPALFLISVTLMTEAKETGDDMGDENKTYKKLVDYVFDQVRQGGLHPGDKLPTERVLATSLGISRNSVREGIRLLENMGIIIPRQGSGNYLSANFDETMSEMLSFMYFFKGMDEGEVTEFRYAIEREALPLAVERISYEEKKELNKALQGLIEAPSEEDQIGFDKKIHRILVKASRNGFLISSYEGLTGFMDTYIKSMRRKIIEGMAREDMLETAHMKLVDGVVEGDLPKAIEGLNDHFGYIEQYR